MGTKSSRQSRRARVKPQRILVPVDFSDSSARALHHAAELSCGIRRLVDRSSTLFRRTTDGWGSGATNHAIWTAHCNGKRQIDYALLPMNTWVTRWLRTWKSVSASPQNKLLPQHENRNAIRLLCRRAALPGWIAISSEVLPIGSRDSRHVPCFSSLRHDVRFREQDRPRLSSI